MKYLLPKIIWKIVLIFIFLLLSGSVCTKQDSYMVLKMDAVAGNGIWEIE
jgi:hypothetical protein